MLKRNAERGFGIAPILYMLMLMGVGAGVLFSGYSQILQTNVRMTNIVTAKGDVTAASNVLTSSAVFGTDGMTFCPPRSGGDLQAGDVCSTGSPTFTPVKMLSFAAAEDVSKLPTSYTAAGTTNAAALFEVGVFKSGSGIKQVDPWGHYYVYCRWENTRANTASPAVAVVSAGPDAVLQTSCDTARTTGKGVKDDIVTFLDVGTAINRSSLWQSTGTNTVSYGATGSQVVVGADGSVTAVNLTVAQTATVNTLIVSGTSSIFHVYGSTILHDLTLDSPLTEANGGTGVSVLNFAWAQSKLGLGTIATQNASAVAITGGVIDGTAIGSTTPSTLIATTATVNSLTATATIAALNITATNGVMANTMTATATISGSVLVSTVATASGFSPLKVSSSTPVANLTANYLGSAGKDDAFFQNATNLTAGLLADARLPVMGGLTVGPHGSTNTVPRFTNDAYGRLTGVTDVPIANLDGSAITPGTLSIANLTGWPLPISLGGTYATTASVARANLGTNDAANLTTGYLPLARLQDNTIPSVKLTTTGVVARTYTWGTVDAQGRVLAGNDVASANYIATDGTSVTTSTYNIIFSTASQQWMILTATGSLGLGTLTPYERFHVDGGNIRISNTAGQSKELQFSTGLNSKRWVVMTDSATESGTKTGSNFRVNSYDNTGTLIGTNFYIERASGNVGIGTTAPGSALDVNGNIQMDGGNVQLAASTGNLYIRTVGNAPVYIQPYASSQPPAAMFVNGGLSLGGSYTSTTPPANGAIIQGSVGIGTTTPAYSLDINGNASTQLMHFTGTTTSQGSIAGTSAGVAGLVQFNDGYNNLAGDQNLFWDNTQKRLGIGTTTPAYSLDVAGTTRTTNLLVTSATITNLSVTGTITNANLTSTNLAGGAVGSIPFQTATSTTGFDSNLFWDNTNKRLGVGTISPLARFVVSANASTPLAGSIASVHLLHVLGADGAGARILIDTYANGAGGAIPMIQLRSSAGTAGSPAPTASGQNIGTVAFSGNTAAAGSYAGAFGAQITAAADADWATGGYPAHLSFSTAGTSGVVTERVRIDNAGNVGIGTTSPSTKLDVVDGSIMMRKSAASMGSIAMNPGGSDYAGYIDFNGPSNRLAYLGYKGGGSGNLGLNLENSANFVINGGNVGIGNTAPAYPLDVTGTARATNILATTATVTNLNVTGTLTASGIAAATATAIMGGAAGYIPFQTAANTTGFDPNHFWDNTNKRLGIGTTSPQARLQVYSGNAIIGDSSAAGPHYLQLVHAGSTSAINTSYLSFANSISSPTSEFTISSMGGARLSTMFNGNEWLTVLPGGNVGIGTTAPQAALQIAQSGTDFQLRIGESSGQFYYNIGRVVSTGALQIQGNQGGNNNITLAPTSGNVGIGTTSPGYKLDVTGDARATGSVYAGANAILCSGCAGGYYQDAANGAYRSILPSSSLSGYYFQSNSGGQTVMYVGLGGGTLGNVGIGTTSPGSRLTVDVGSALDGVQVNSSTQARLLLNNTVGGQWIEYVDTSGNLRYYNGAERILVNSSGNVGIGTASPSMPLDVNTEMRVSGTGATNAYGIVSLGNRDNGTYVGDNGIYRGGIGSLANGNYLNVSSYQGIVFTASNAAFGAQTTRMFIDGASGNVGVGTTGPNRRLDVATSNDGLTIGQDADNSETIQTYIDGAWGARTTYASACCNQLKIQPDAGYTTFGGGVIINSNASSGGDLTVSGNASVSGSLSVGSFNPSNLTVGGTLTLPVNVWHKDSNGAGRIYFGSGERTYIKSASTSTYIATFRTSDDADKMHVGSDGNIWMSWLGDWISNRLGQDVRSGANPTFGNIYGNAQHLLINGVTWGSNWTWSGQGGQPTWLWGSNDGSNMYIWNPSNFSVNYATSAGSAGNASTADKTNTHLQSPDAAYPGTGMYPFSSWNTGCAGNGSAACYSNGISVGSHPGDQAYGFQIVSNMWDDQLYFRRYNAGWQGWRTVIDSTNIASQSVSYANSAGSANSVAWGNVSSKPWVTTVGWNWAGQGGQPTWMWGSNDGSNMYVWNPSNFSVNYATTAGTANAVSFNGGLTSGSSPTFASASIGSMTISAGNGDAANFNNVNTVISSWFGVGFRSTCCGNPVTYPIAFDTRSGHGFFYGNVGVGTTDTSYKLNVAGSINALGGLYQSSDIRLKEEIKPVEGAVDKLLQLRGVSFKWKKDGRADYGVIAQEAEKVFPELVSTAKDGFKSVSYNGFVAPLIESVRELKVANDGLKAEVEALKANAATSVTQMNVTQSGAAAGAALAGAVEKDRPILSNGGVILLLVINGVLFALVGGLAVTLGRKRK